MSNTVKWVLLSLNLNEFTHVVVRRHAKPGIEYLGGGSVSSVLSRFGDMLIEDSCIIDGVFVLYVK